MRVFMAVDKRGQYRSHQSFVVNVWFIIGPLVDENETSSVLRRFLIFKRLTLR